MAGKIKLAMMAIIEITTRSSIKVKARPGFGWEVLIAGGTLMNVCVSNSRTPTIAYFRNLESTFEQFQKPLLLQLVGDLITSFTINPILLAFLQTVSGHPQGPC
jgi:hypothetical protein